jgi:hypothetical protein
MPLEFSSSDELAFQEAFRCLADPSWGDKLMRLADRPVEALWARLPAGMRQRISAATERALSTAAKAALWSLASEGTVHPWSEFWHKAAVAATGAAAGLVGLEALLVELPLSTTIMLRSIADIAKAQGEALEDPDTALNVVQVLALGDVGILDYLALRRAWAAELRAAALYLGRRAGADTAAPVVARVVARVASRYQVQVGELAAAEVIPVVGAVSGGLLNWLFLEHFQSKATGHFIIRRLERTYGREYVADRIQSAAKAHGLTWHPAGGDSASDA